MVYVTVFVPLAASVFFAFIALTMYVTGSWASDSEDVEPFHKEISGPLFLLIVFAWNIAVSCMLSLYYQSDIDDIILTLATLAFLWPCAVIDCRVHLIPNRILGIALIIRGAWFAIEAIILPETIGIVLLSSFIAGTMLLFTSFLCKVLIPHSLGMGDVKILAVMGLYLGMDKIWGAVFSGFFILFIVCLVLLALRRADRKTEIAFAPFLLAGTLLGAFLTGI